MTTVKDSKDKPKGGILDATKKGFFRATQKVKESLGKAEQTVDISYNQEVERFRSHYRAVKKINRDAVKFLECLRDFTVAESALVEDFASFYDANHPTYTTTQRARDMSKAMDSARMQFDDQMRQDFIDPTAKYLGQFKEVKLRLPVCETRRVDMDRYDRDLHTLQKNGSAAKVPQAEQKLAQARANYQALFDELMRDLPRLYDDRTDYFDCAVGTFLTAQCEYFRQCTKANVDTIGSTQLVNGAAIHQRPRVVEPAETSVAGVSRVPTPPKSAPAERVTAQPSGNTSSSKPASSTQLQHSTSAPTVYPVAAVPESPREGPPSPAEPTQVHAPTNPFAQGANRGYAQPAVPAVAYTQQAAPGAAYPQPMPPLPQPSGA
eukprot:TRINITY_DN4066_c1_g1_i2.p1 TRINITY_DN4066_c1_g1~~TRINITY_DN4066_c1_g1_i2.p1  ORF type:complete len:378 (+),score=79.33 TRINITY_DN4066_c1_g1_i2:111-1244(+)